MKEYDVKDVSVFVGGKKVEGFAGEEIYNIQESSQMTIYIVVCGCDMDQPPYVYNEAVFDEKRKAEIYIEQKGYVYNEYYSLYNHKEVNYSWYKIEEWGINSVLEE